MRDERLPSHETLIKVVSLCILMVMSAQQPPPTPRMVLPSPPAPQQEDISSTPLLVLSFNKSQILDILCNNSLLSCCVSCANFLEIRNISSISKSLVCVNLEVAPCPLPPPPDFTRHQSLKRRLNEGQRRLAQCLIARHSNLGTFYGTELNSEGEGPSRGLLRDYESSDGPSFQALLGTQLMR